MRSGLNQYPPMAGIPVLRERIAAKMEALYGHRYDPVAEITVTAGATQAILTAVLAFVGPGDEVIVLDPCYDSYAPNVELAGGRAVHVPLQPQTFRPDFDRIAAALGAEDQGDHRQLAAQPERHGLVADDMARLAELLRRPTSSSSATRSTSTWSTTASTRARRALPELAARTFVVSSFGKTYHVTGWKVGYAPRLRR